MDRRKFFSLASMGGIVALAPPAEAEPKADPACRECHGSGRVDHMGRARDTVTGIDLIPTTTFQFVQIPCPFCIKK